ncbi:MAG: RNA methyltransferase [Proteobacteria bacterium]|nr:RNA methyltransferase [Pseudomonadota bacterium]
MREITNNGNIYVGLVHYPVYDRKGNIVATAVTTVDIHDIARSAKTFDVKSFYVITPLESQGQLVRRLLRHWIEGRGATYNPTRQAALSLVKVEESTEGVVRDISRHWNSEVQVVATGARSKRGNIGYDQLREMLSEVSQPFLLLFGTGWGLTEEVIRDADYILAPIEGSHYNHLSVRSAVAIILDRLLGRG